MSHLIHKDIYIYVCVYVCVRADCNQLISLNKMNLKLMINLIRSGS